MHHKKKRRVGEDWASWNRALFVKFMLWWVSRWRDNSPKSPGNAWIFSGSNQFAALLTFANISWFSFQSIQSIHRFEKKKRLHHMQVLCCRFQDPLYTGTWHDGSSLLSPPAFYTSPSNTRTRTTQPIPPTNQSCYEQPVRIWNLLSIYFIIRRLVDFWQNDLDSRSFLESNEELHAKGPLRQVPHEFFRRHKWATKEKWKARNPILLIGGNGGSHYGVISKAA